MARLSQGEALALLGRHPNEIARELSVFSANAQAFSSAHSKLVEEHAQQWVALYDGVVTMFSDSLADLMAKLADSGHHSQDVVIRFISKDENTLIL